MAPVHGACLMSPQVMHTARVASELSSWRHHDTTCTIAHIIHLLSRLTTILQENAMRMGCPPLLRVNSAWLMALEPASYPSPGPCHSLHPLSGPMGQPALHVGPHDLHPLSALPSIPPVIRPICPGFLSPWPRTSPSPTPPAALPPPAPPPCHQANVPWLSPPDIRYPYEGVHNDLLTMLKIRQLSRWLSVFMFNQVGVYVYRACITCVLLVYRMCTAHVPHTPVVQPMVSVFIGIDASSANSHSPLPARCQSDTPRSLPSLYSGCHPVDTQQHLLVYQGALLGCSTISYVLLTWSASDLSPR